MVTILMAAYQGEKYIGQQIESILAQEDSDWRLVIWDDGSTDGTPLVLSAYANQYPDRILVKRNAKNLGAAKNFLSMVMEYPGDYYMFADQDDVWNPDKLTRTKKRLLAMEAKYGREVPALVSTDALVTDENLKELHPSFTRLQHFDMRKRTFSHILMENLCIGCTMMFNAALAKLLVQCPEQARYHDWWMALLAGAFGHISYLDAATLKYRQHGNNVVGTTTFSDYVKQRIRNREGNRELLEKTFRQAEEFRSMYGNHPELKKEAKEALESFCRLPEQKPASRVRNVVRHGFLKSGKIRNAGLLFYLLKK